MWTFIAHQIVNLQAIGSIALLVGFLIATSLLQQRAVSHSVEVLNGLPERVRNTESFRSAVDYCDRRIVPHLFTKGAHAVPVWFLIIVVLFCSAVSYFGAELFNGAPTPSYVLGGAVAATANPDPDKVKPGISTVDPAGKSETSTGLLALAPYQSSTVFTASMAFLGAYIWVIAQLVTRINNSDMNPITYYFLSVRILTACLVAGIARHIVEAIPGLRDAMYFEGVPVGLAALGFVIGWNPTLWINELLLWIYKLFRRTVPYQRWPAQANLPGNMTLSMVQGLVDGKIERLMEIDIDNCQKLATENPVIIWLRTQYNLILILDWISQAQLCVLFEDDKVKLLRQVGIRDMCAYYTAIFEEEGRTQIQIILRQQVSLPIINAQFKAISADPAFQRLLELRKALQTS
jgi:hypothetical protein